MYIVNEEEYRIKIRNYIDSVLNGRLFEINPYSASAEEISAWLVNYDNKNDDINNCCTWLEIGETGQEEYKGHEFKYVKFLTVDGEAPFGPIPFSRFLYPMSPYKEIKGVPHYDSSVARYYNTIDGERVDYPERYFEINRGRKILFLYNINCVSKYNSREKCFSFALEKKSEKDIRDYISKAQIAILNDMLQNPNLINFPCAEIYDDALNKRTLCECDLTEEFAIKVFNMEYKEKLKKMLNDSKYREGDL